MNQVRTTIFQTFKFVVVFNMVAIAVVTIFMQNPFPVVLGMLFGAALGMLNFYELALTLEKAVKMAPGKANTFATVKYLLRFIITAVALFVAIKSPQLHILGAIFGLLSIKLVVYAINLLSDKAYFKKIFVRKEE